MSYSRRDAELMRRLCDDLRVDGVNIWDDQLLEPGTASWKNAIESAIENSTCVVVLLSPDSKQSEWVERELDYARSQGKAIIPVMIRGDERDAVPFELISVQRADIRRDYALGLQDLKEALCQKLRLPQLCDSVQRFANQRQQAEARRRYEADLLPRDESPAALDNQQRRRLRFWNPLDYVRLLYNLFLNPAQLSQYEQGSVRGVTVWIVSGLVWLPVLLSFVASGRSEVNIDLEFIQWQSRISTIQVVLAFGFTALLGMVLFDVPSGLRAFLRGPALILSALLGVAAAGILWVNMENQPLFSGTPQLRTLVMLSGASLSALAALAIGSAAARGLANQVAGWVALLLALLTAYSIIEPARPLGQTLLPPSFIQDIGIENAGVIGICGVVIIYGLLYILSVGALRASVERRRVSTNSSLVALLLIIAYLLIFTSIASG